MLGLELHMNTVAVGLTMSPSLPEYPQNHQSHLTLEPSIGLFPWWELGGYFETAIRGEQGEFDYAGVKLRNKFVTPPNWSAHWRLGLNIEFSLLPQGYDRDRWGNELRPIVAFENKLFEIVVNPIVDSSLAGPDASAGPAFEPCLSAVYKVHEAVSLGIEYYTNLGPFRSGFLPLREQEHYLYEVFNLLSVKHYELNAGVGEGLTPGSTALIFKVILGYEWREGRGARGAGLDAPSKVMSAPQVVRQRRPMTTSMAGLSNHFATSSWVKLTRSGSTRTTWRTTNSPTIVAPRSSARRRASLPCMADAAPVTTVLSMSARRAGTQPGSATAARMSAATA